MSRCYVTSPPLQKNHLLFYPVFSLNLAQFMYSMCLVACQPSHTVKRNVQDMEQRLTATQHWAHNSFLKTLSPDSHREDPRHNIRNKIQAEEMHKRRFQLSCRIHTVECLLKHSWAAEGGTFVSFFLSAPLLCSHLVSLFFREMFSTVGL